MKNKMRKFYVGVKKVLTKMLQIMTPILALYRLIKELAERIDKR